MEIHESRGSLSRALQKKGATIRALEALGASTLSYQQEYYG